MQTHPLRGLVAVLAAVVFSSLAISANAAQSPDVSPPNVVLIISDDQAWTDYGFMGHAHMQTPNLDRLARESVTFKRGYVPTALCRPSLMTLATGHYAHRHGVTGNCARPASLCPSIGWNDHEIDPPTWVI
jgi:arylsulfatase A-like enzyme